jgi:hypothetical protein
VLTKKLMCACNCFAGESLRERQAGHEQRWIGRFSIPHLREQVRVTRIIRPIQSMESFTICLRPIFPDESRIELADRSLENRILFLSMP